MKTNYEIRYAAHPEDAKSYDTARIRRDFLIEKIFVPNEVNMVYSMYDRMVVGGALPVGEVLTLEAIDPLKAPFFLTRREMGIYNVGGPGVVKAGDAIFELDYKEALYLGSGDRVVTFESKDASNPAKFYFNSLTAHRNYPDRKVTKADAVVAEMGSLEGSNHRNINKMLVNQVLPTCQLQMGMTELAPGSVWNTVGNRCHIGAGTVLAGVVEPASATPVVIEDDVMIGANAVVIEGVRVGRGAVVGAGAIVIKDVPAGAVVVGNPARIIKMKDEKTEAKTALIDALRTLD